MAETTTTSPKPVEEKWTDGQILEVVQAANAGELVQAKAALRHSKDPDIRKLATIIVKDLSEANAKAAELGRKGGKLGMKASPLSTTLETDGRAATTSMATLSGTEFDKVYIDSQVKAQQTVLMSIDQKLLPNVQSSEVKGLLHVVRGKMSQHLGDAKMLQVRLSK